MSLFPIASGIDIAQKFTQTVMFIALLLPLALHPAVRLFVRELSPRYRLGGIVLLGLLFLGHLTKHAEATFPFITWQMYGEDSGGEVAQWFTIEGVTDNGTMVPINPSHLFPTLDRGTLRLPNLVHDLILEDEKVRPGRKEFLQGVARVYQQQTGTPLTEIRVRRHRGHFTATEFETQLITSEPIE